MSASSGGGEGQPPPASPEVRLLPQSPTAGTEAVAADGDRLFAGLVPVAEGLDGNGNHYGCHVAIREGSEIQGGCAVGCYSEINGATIYPRTVIGKYCSVARGAAVGAPDHPLDCLGTSLALRGTKDRLILETTTIGNDVWIGANAVIRGGVTIGHGAVIAAAAVVTRDVPPFAIVVGVPGKVTRRRFSDEVCAALLASHWWDLPHGIIDCLPHGDIAATLRRLEIISRLGLYLPDSAGDDRV